MKWLTHHIVESDNVTNILWRTFLLYLQSKQETNLCFLKETPKQANVWKVQNFKLFLIC